MIKFNKNMWQLHDALDGKIRLVGGAVRDYLAGVPIKDWDFCTPYIPDVAMEKIWECPDVTDIIKTGLAHGTFTVLFNDGERYEVTTLRMDVRCDGRHAEVAFTDNYFVDASRRDFTMNAMSYDFEGNLYDYFGGQKDLKDGVVCFVGAPADRIKEDYLRIMRWFRFSVRYGNSAINHVASMEAREAIVKNAEGLKQVSKERIWSELHRMLNEPAEKVGPALFAMQEYGVLHATGVFYTWDHASPAMFIDACNSFNTPETRLASLWQYADIKEHALDLKWSGEQLERALFVHEHFPVMRLRAKYLLAVKKAKIDWVIETLADRSQEEEIRKFAESLPKFPVKGEDVMIRTKAQGKAIGIIIDKLKEVWAMSDYTMTEKELLCLVS